MTKEIRGETLIICYCSLTKEPTGSCTRINGFTDLTPNMCIEIRWTDTINFPVYFSRRESRIGKFRLYKNFRPVPLTSTPHESPPPP